MIDCKRAKLIVGLVVLETEDQNATRMSHCQSRAGHWTTGLKQSLSALRFDTVVQMTCMQSASGHVPRTYQPLFCGVELC